MYAVVIYVENVSKKTTTDIINLLTDTLSDLTTPLLAISGNILTQI